MSNNNKTELSNKSDILTFGINFKDYILSRCKDISFRKFISNLLGSTLILMTIILAMWYVTSIVDGTEPIFRSAIFWMLLVGILTVAFGEFMGVSPVIPLSVNALIIIGTSVQSLLIASKLAGAGEDAPIIKFVLDALAGCALGVIAVPFVSYLKKHRNLGIYLSFGLSFILYIALLAFGTSSHGTKAWLFFFQATDVTKVLFVFTTACILSSNQPALKRLTASAINLAMHVFFLWRVNELGTAILIGIVYLLLLFMFPALKEAFKSAKRLTKIIIAVVVSLCIISVPLFFGASYLCYKSEAKAEASYSQSENESDSTAQDDSDGENSDKKGSSVTHTMALQYLKIHNRCVVLSHPENHQELPEANQVLRAINALSISNFFGSGLYYHVPVFSSDYVYDYVLMKAGVAFGILALVLVALIFIAGVYASTKTSSRTERAIATGFLLTIAIQSFISTANALCIIPTIGVPFAFISSGGTAMLTNMAMIFTVMFMIRDSRLDFGSNTKESIKTSNNEGGEG